MAFIELKDVSVTFKKGTPQQVPAIRNVSLSIDKGEFVGIIGPTGSGKSTLIQLFNGLIKPTNGKVLIEGKGLFDIKRTELKNIRSNIGLVFQYPENQLFEETVAKDVAFGPRNLGLRRDDVEKRVVHAMEFVGLDYDTFRNRAPISLSGGEMRRVALAGVLAMEPQMLVLDEPAAGMDPNGRQEILDRVARIHSELNIGVVLVSHNMEDIARLAQRVLLLYEGKIVFEGTSREVFSQDDSIRKYGLDLPSITELVFKLKDLGVDIRTDIFTVREAKEELVRLLRRAGDV